jgi:predicted ATPase
LASISDPVAIPEAVAAVLGITQQPGMTVANSVASALEGRSRLLVFDNCEHVLDAAADLIDRILARSPTAKVLATSREGLRVSDEQLWPVASLDGSSTAATLFVERALSVAPRAALTAGDTAVIEICRHLDGIPLAIELAASRMQSMTASEIWDRLDDRFRLLVGSRRGLERHQTLRHAVQWSFDLLGDAEKLVLARCSVFAGGFDLAGACAVSGSSDEFAVLDLLDALVRKSLLVADKWAERTRFSMLETIRQFAEEQLIARGEADLARNAHAKYFAGWETELLALWNSPRQREAFAWFTVELANLRTAFRWAADQSDLDTAAAIAVYACPLGNWLEQHEPNGWAEALVEPARAVGHPRLAQLYVHAAQCALTGRTEDAVGYAEAGLAAIASGRYDPVPFGFEAFLGNPYLMRGQPDKGCSGAATRSRESTARTHSPTYILSSCWHSPVHLAKRWLPRTDCSPLPARTTSSGGASRLRRTVVTDSSNHTSRSSCRDWRSTTATPWTPSTSSPWPSAIITIRAASPSSALR